MKKYVFLFLLMACSEEEVKIKLDSSILGTWILVSSERSQCDNPDYNFFEEFDCKVNCKKYNFTDSEVIITTYVDGAAWAMKTVDYSINNTTLSLVTGEIYEVTIGDIMRFDFNEYGCEAALVFKR